MKDRILKFLNCLQGSKTENKTIYEKLNTVCNVLPYEKILSEQDLILEYYHQKSSLAIVRDDTTNSRYIVSINYMNINYKHIPDRKLKLGNLTSNVESKLQINRVSKIYNLLIFQNNVDCIYHELYSHIQRCLAR